VVRYDSGAVIEYAVKMCRFTGALLDVLVDSGDTCETTIVSLAEHSAEVHATAPLAEHGTAYGTKALVESQVEKCIEPLSDYLDDTLRAVLRVQIERSRKALTSRQGGRHIRDCHGDLHLANVVMHRGR
jgi:uncharacterized protein